MKTHFISVETFADILGIMREGHLKARVTRPYELEEVMHFFGFNGFFKSYDIDAGRVRTPGPLSQVIAIKSRLLDLYFSDDLSLRLFAQAELAGRDALNLLVRKQMGNKNVINDHYSISLNVTDDVVKDLAIEADAYQQHHRRAARMRAEGKILTARQIAWRKKRNCRDAG